MNRTNTKLYNQVSAWYQIYSKGKPNSDVAMKLSPLSPSIQEMFFEDAPLKAYVLHRTDTPVPPTQFAYKTDKNGLAYYEYEGEGLVLSFYHGHSVFISKGSCRIHVIPNEILDAPESIKQIAASILDIIKVNPDTPREEMINDVSAYLELVSV